MSGVRVYLPAGATAPSITGEKGDARKAREGKALVANAKWPADSLRLAGPFHAMAHEHEVEGEEPQAPAAEYAKAPDGQQKKHSTSGQAAEQRKYNAEHRNKAAAEMRAMVPAHTAREMHTK